MQRNLNSEKKLQFEKQKSKRKMELNGKIT